MALAVLLEHMRDPGKLDTLGFSVYNSHLSAGIAQLVERLLPKQKVTGSSPVTRS